MADTEVLAWAGGVAAVLAAGTLLIGLAQRSVRARPWLLILFGVNADRGDVTFDALGAVQPVDVLLLVLAGVTYAGFWPGPGGSQPWWMLLAIAQPLLGIAILLVTRLAGRSGLMGGALVLSILMVIDDPGTATGWLGVVASVLLLVGDFGTTERRPSQRLAPVIALGYAALVGWFGWIAVVLLR